MTVAILNAEFRPLLEAKLPGWVVPRWFTTAEELLALAPEAEIGWFDIFDSHRAIYTPMYQPTLENSGSVSDSPVTEGAESPLAFENQQPHNIPALHEALRRATGLKWLSTLSAGVEALPLDLLRERRVILTNGAGINAITISEYAVMGMLTIAKGYRRVVEAQQRHEWLTESPGKVELYRSKALILGAGAIGGHIAERLRAFSVDVVTVRRRPSPGAIAPDEWRARLHEFDWVIVTVPCTAETDKMIGEAELAAMKPEATIMNFSRGSVIDQEALVEALRAKRIGAAFLDVTDPEPLPAHHPLWLLENAHVTMHLSGRSQSAMFQRSSERFLANLEHYASGEPVAPQVDLSLGY